MRVDYEEKTFESALNQELLGSSGRIYAPGQVLEAILGFDAGLWVGDPSFWTPWNRWPPGLSLASSSWPRWGRSPPLPAFRLNLFLQHKRPEYLASANANEWDIWKAPYFRFGVVAHQQRSLAAGAAAAGTSAVVAYSCPAVKDAKRLFEVIEARTLVSETNFVEAIRLQGHRVYSYRAGGQSGVAHSEPEEVEPILLTNETIDQLVAKAGDDFLTSARNVMRSMLLTHPSLKEKEGVIEERVAEFFVEPGFRTRLNSVRKFFYVIWACNLLGVSWLVAG